MRIQEIRKEAMQLTDTKDTKFFQSRLEDYYKIYPSAREMVSHHIEETGDLKLGVQKHITEDLSDSVLDLESFIVCVK